MLYKAFRKYGFENFSFEIVEECNPEELNLKEIYYIKEFNSCLLFKNSNGYNMTTGGDSAYNRTPCSEEKKEKLRKANLGKKIILSKEGLKVKQETAKLINSRKVECNGCTYPSVADFARFYNLNEETVRSWLNGRNKMPKRWYDQKLRYVNEEGNKYIKVRGDKYTSSSSKAIMLGNVRYNSIRELAQSIGVNEKTVRRWLKREYNPPKHIKEMGLRLCEVNDENK